MQAPALLVLSKFDIAERQFNQAVVLFFSEGDPVSIHTLAEAAAQALYDITRLPGSDSQWRDSDRIRPERRREWLGKLAESKSFFRHADHDANAAHLFREEFNHFSLLDATGMYLSAKKSWTPETVVFMNWFAVTYPEFIHQADLAAAMEGHSSRRQFEDEWKHRKLCAMAIRELRAGRRVLPGIELAQGLPGDEATTQVRLPP